MSKMYIRVRKDGFIYEYNEILAQNIGCEVIPEEVAFPERFMPAHAVEAMSEAPTKKTRRKPVDLITADIPEAPPYTPPELAEDAARGMP